MHENPPTSGSEEKKPTPTEGGLLKKIGLAAGMVAAGTAALGSEGNNAEKELINSDHRIETAFEDTTTKKGGNNADYASGFADGKVNVYTGSKTKEGGITPTGLSNDFLENKYGVTVEDLERIAKKYGFRTDNNSNFLTDLVNYLEKNNPEIITKTFEEFGTTAHGKELEAQGKSPEDAEALKDGKIGGRTAFMIDELKKTETVTGTAKTPEQKEEAEQPRGGFVINVRGDASNGRGAYYFIENEADFKKLISLVSPNHSEIKDDNVSGGATYDMNQNVFLEEHANSEEARKLLGQSWLRDPDNSKKFIKKNVIQK